MQLTLTVPETYVLPAWFHTADPSDVATCLDVAARIHTLTSKGDLRQVFDEACRVESGKHERTTMELQLEVESLKESLQEREMRIFDLEAKRRNDEESTKLKVQQAQAESELQIQTLKNEATALTQNFDFLQVSLESRVAQAVLTAVSQEREGKLEMEQKMCEVTRQMHEAAERHHSTVLALKERITELESPMGRGRAGELDVARALEAMGLQVVDTSMGEMKDRGYLDLLVTTDDASNMRIAIENKNKATVQKQDRDDFERKVRAGIENDLFDAAIFVSIRAHTKKKAPVALEMYADESRRPLIPVSWIGPESAKTSPPLMQEQLETHVAMMFELLDRCHAIRKDMCSGLRDEHVQSVQIMTDVLAAGLNETFSDMAKQHKLIDDMKAILTNMRVRCIHMFTSLWKTNKDTAWLGRALDAPWMETYQTALAKSTTHKDADIWNQCSRSKALIDRTIGKDAMLIAIRKRPRGAEPPTDT